jgi:hypothetical protein
METASQKAGAETAPVIDASFIANDRVEGIAAIGSVLFPGMPPLEVGRRLRRGGYPFWREGRKYVASKAALLKHWQEKAGLVKPSQPQPGARQPKDRSTRRGYRPA